MREITDMHIKGITGLRYMYFLDRFDGKNDARNNQICKMDDGVTTPRIIQKCRSCDRYTNELYITAIEELKALYIDIAVCIKQLEETKDRRNDITNHSDSSSEEALRRVANNENKRSALVVHLAELKQNCSNVDETLKHNLDRARAILHEHTVVYWSGLLQGASGEKLPATPKYTEENISGKAEYTEQYTRVMSMFESVDQEV